MLILTHEFKQLMGLKKIETKKMVVVVPLFSTFGPKE
jgi:hypothetical protein